jgi:ABC-type lipoprotein export system ATPase subunit
MQWLTIANHPQLISADEPTANLDAAHGAETMRLLRRLAKDEKTTVVIVSHDQRLREIADRVLWLGDGPLERLGRSSVTPSAGCCSIRLKRRHRSSAMANVSTSAHAAAVPSTNRAWQRPRTSRA